MNQIPLNIYRSSTQLATALTCERLGIALNAYSPLGVPDWHTYPAGHGMSATTLEDPVVTGIAVAHNRSAAAVIINWLWYGLGAVTNPRTRDIEHMVRGVICSTRITHHTRAMADMNMAHASGLPCTTLGSLTELARRHCSSWQWLRSGIADVRCLKMFPLRVRLAAREPRLLRLSS